MNHQTVGAVITCSWLPSLPGRCLNTGCSCLGLPANLSQKQCGQGQLCTCLGRHAGTCLPPPGLYRLPLCPSTSALHPPVTNIQLPEQHPIGIDVHSFAHEALCQKLCRQAEGVFLLREVCLKRDRQAGTSDGGL